MDSLDKSAFYIYVISCNKMARLGKGYSTQQRILDLILLDPYLEDLFNAISGDLDHSGVVHKLEEDFKTIAKEIISQQEG